METVQVLHLRTRLVLVRVRSEVIRLGVRKLEPSVRLEWRWSAKRMPDRNKQRKVSGFSMPTRQMSD